MKIKGYFNIAGITARTYQTVILKLSPHSDPDLYLRLVYLDFILFKRISRSANSPSHQSLTAKKPAGKPGWPVKAMHPIADESALRRPPSHRACDGGIAALAGKGERPAQSQNLIKLGQVDGNTRRAAGPRTAIECGACRRAVLMFAVNSSAQTFSRGGDTTSSV